MSRHPYPYFPTIALYHTHKNYTPWRNHLYATTNISSVTVNACSTATHFCSNTHRLFFMLSIFTHQSVPFAESFWQLTSYSNGSPSLPQQCAFQSSLISSPLFTYPPLLIDYWRYRVWSAVLVVFKTILFTTSHMNSTSWWEPSVRDPAQNVLGVFLALYAHGYMQRCPRCKCFWRNPHVLIDRYRKKQRFAFSRLVCTCEERIKLVYELRPKNNPSMWNCRKSAARRSVYSPNAMHWVRISV